MTVSPGDDPVKAARNRTRDQVQQIVEGDPDLIVSTETGDSADLSFICDSHHLLVAPADPAGPEDENDAVQRLQDYFGTRLGTQSTSAPQDDDLDPESPWGPVGRTRAGLARRYRPPARANDDQDLLDTLNELDEQFGRGFAQPDHYVHVAPGKPTICPATEPAETGLAGPWPGVNPDSTAGDGVNVVVVDTGWHAPAGAQPWLGGVTGVAEPQGVYDAQGRIRPYAGHGTFVAGVIRAIAPACTVHVLSLHVDPNQPGGGVREHELAQQLDRALRRRPRPHLINLSAGTRSRFGLPPRAFELWWEEARRTRPDLVLVAAAGNDSSAEDFWPASFGWAVGVGSLDRDGQVSGYSNYGPSVDAYALGRNIVNAFPLGQYIGHERPIIGDERTFTQMLARWSGTSFATPIVTGLIAVAMSRQPRPRSARAARHAVLAHGVQQRGPTGNRVSRLRQPYF